MDAERIVYDAVVVASGKGKRTGLAYNKVFCIFPDGETVLEKALRVFQQDADCRKIIVVLAAEDSETFKPTGKVVICRGGRERTDSVANGLQEVTSPYVMVHDGARPYIGQDEIERLKEALRSAEGATLSLPIRDSVKYGINGKIVRSVERENLYLAQTPQAFRSTTLRQAYSLREPGCIYGDEAALCEAAGIEVALVKGALTNIKITFPEDIPHSRGS